MLKSIAGREGKIMQRMLNFAAFKFGCFILLLLFFGSKDDSVGAHFNRIQTSNAS